MTEFFVVEEYGFRYYTVETSLSVEQLKEWWKTVVPVTEDGDRVEGLPRVDLFRWLPNLKITLNPNKSCYRFSCHLHTADDSDLDGEPPEAWIEAEKEKSFSKPNAQYVAIRI